MAIHENNKVKTTMITASSLVIPPAENIVDVAEVPNITAKTRNINKTIRRFLAARSHAKGLYDFSQASLIMCRSFADVAERLLPLVEFWDDLFLLNAKSFR